MRWRLLATAFLGVLALAIAGGWLWWILRPPVAGPLRLTKVSFSDLPNWRTSDPRPALAAFVRSCTAMTGKNAPGYAGPVSDWQAPCSAARARTSAGARRFFERWFTPLAAGAGAVKDGLFTGYYEPELRVSRTQHGAFQSPIYDTPSDLVSVDLGAFRPALRGESIAGRLDGQHLVPYATRAQIDADGLPKAHVLFYADDPVAVFFLHIQGSGRVRFADGHMARVSYAAQNGQPYSAIGRALIQQGAMTKENTSLQTIRAWLRTHPALASKVMETDKSYVFFKEEPIGDPALGAKGAQGVPLTPMASLAVDRKLFALGTPFFISTTTPDGKPLQSLFIAQDSGGAIHGPVRADIFFGFGSDAENRAGGMKQTGRAYILLPKPVAARLKERTDFPDGPL